MSRHTLISMSLMLAYNALAGAEEPRPAAEAKPQWQRVLTGDEAKKAAELQRLIFASEQAGRIDATIPLHEKLLALRTAAQGADHWETASQKQLLAYARKMAALTPDQQVTWQRAFLGAFAAKQLEAQGQHAKAQPRLEEFCRQAKQLFGEESRLSAQGDTNLALNLNAQGKYADAQPLLKNALDVHRKLIGEKHPDTAICQGNLADNLDAQGKYLDAQTLFQTALEVHREALGERHHYTAQSYNNLALNLNHQGKYAEAQPLCELALKLRRELFGENHHDTASSYNNLASNLDAQRKHAEAQPLYELALKLRRKLLGEKHPDTAGSYNNLATNLDAQGKYADAQPHYQKALDLYRQTLGEKHPNTITAYNNVAYNLGAQRKYAEAQPLLQKALDLRREGLREKHPQTAIAYCNLADNLRAQGKFAGAQPLCQKALDLCRELLGENHPYTAVSYGSLAANLVVQGDYAGAQPLLTQAAASYEATRLSAADRGLDRAVFGGERSPYRLLSATWARLGDSEAAWLAAERDLARGLSDESASRRGADLSPEEEGRRTALVDRLSQIAPLILQLVSKQSATDEEQNELVKLQRERTTLENKLAELAVQISQGELAAFAQVQAAIPADGALVLWVDDSDQSQQLQEHWGCVVRRSGPPRWERLPAGDSENKWTDDDSLLPRKLVSALSQGAAANEVAEAAAKLYAQRIAPLEKCLEGVKRLFVVPVNAMAGVPVEVLTKDMYTVSYVPSGTILARLKERPRPEGESLLALGDPAFPPAETPKEPPLPPGGLLIRFVEPGGNAAQADLQSGDVLLKYAGIDLTKFEQFKKLIQEHAKDESIKVMAWRDGVIAERQLRPGIPGVALDMQPAPQATAAKREADKMLLAVRGGDWKELPGTSVEVARLKVIAGDERTTQLTRSKASEQELEQLRANGKLAEFRYLHFATHGEPNNLQSFESALILAQDHVSTNIPTTDGKLYDGRLTANEILENWTLDADLVTLSACESALGRPGGGDGLLGFAQVFLLAGSRAVCLTLWKVDDKATAILMDRFYQNLFGKRPGLAEPMGKAEALAEAKRWLRELTRDEAKKLAAAVDDDLARAKGETAQLEPPAVDARSTSTRNNRPYSHPRYWAAFILIGDPN